MNFLFELNHPKHYYQFKSLIEKLRNNKHQVLIIARDKDVLLDVLNNEKVEYKVFGKYKKGIFGKIFNTLSLLLSLWRISNEFDPDVYVSKASLYCALIAKVKSAKSIIFPDSEVVKLTNKLVVPLSTTVVTPDNFGLDFGEKHIRVNGFFENIYLSPNYFKPQYSLIKHELKRPYAILRFVGWNANHDINNSGFSLSQKIKLIETLEQYLTIYISSEEELPDELKNYKLIIKPSIIHHVLYFADLYIGDSQTMATEAALLGTPAIRSNSFVGSNDMSNFIKLEKEYQLLHNLKEFDDVLSLATDFARDSQKEKWMKKRSEYNKNITDINQTIYQLLVSFE